MDRGRLRHLDEDGGSVERLHGDDRRLLDTRRRGTQGGVVVSAARRRAEADEKPTCPECGHHHVARRTRGPGPEDTDEDWRCEGCGTLFNEPDYREMKSNDDPKKGAAAILADPDVTTIEEVKQKYGFD